MTSFFSSTHVRKRWSRLFRCFVRGRYLCVGHRRNQECLLSWVKRQVLTTFLHHPIMGHWNCSQLSSFLFRIGTTPLSTKSLSPDPNFRISMLLPPSNMHAMAKTLDDLGSARASKLRKPPPTGRMSQGVDCVVVAEKGAARDNNWRNK